MSNLIFSKYHGAGNDFILIDDRAQSFNCSLVPKLCHRQMGIGADGVILLQPNFRMRIFNADGSEAEGCGNGLRCLVQFLYDLGFAKKNYTIQMGERRIVTWPEGEKIALRLGSVANVKRFYIEDLEVHFLNTGVPHAVLFCGQPLHQIGPRLQSHPAFGPAGSNINVAQINGQQIRAQTFERGVGATLSCGTGAMAIGYVAIKNYQMPSPLSIIMPGGELKVALDNDQLILIGDAVKVFSGEL